MQQWLLPQRPLQPPLPQLNKEILMKTTRIGILAGLAVGVSLLLSGCERPPMDVDQIGYRGVGMEQVKNKRTQAQLAAANQAPEALPPADPNGPKARNLYKNVKVLGDLSEAQFNNLMAAMTLWVAPEQGCAYCHNLENFADDSLYTKVTARKMTEMTLAINSQWTNHVGNTGVTCYTCHRGNNVPEKRWFSAPDVKVAGRLLGNDNGQNRAGVEANGNTSLPYDAFTPYLLEDKEIRMAGTTALPTGNRQSIKQTEWTHSLMIHMSEGLGVNCTYCHNTRAMAEWEQSTPARLTAWHGIRMVRDLNNTWVVPLTAIQPANQLGPTGDISKINCATCHNGVNKPLYGTSMLTSFPELAGKKAVVAKQ